MAAQVSERNQLLVGQTPLNTMRLTDVAVTNLFIVVPAERRCAARYEANWTSLDVRLLPQWYDNAKIGILSIGRSTPCPPKQSTHEDIARLLWVAAQSLTMHILHAQFCIFIHVKTRPSDPFGRHFNSSCTVGKIWWSRTTNGNEIIRALHHDGYTASHTPKESRNQKIFARLFITYV